MKMFIMQGLPGSGKSTLARDLVIQHNATVCSADHYFERVVDGVTHYNFNAKKLGAAHQSCRDLAEKAMIEKRNVVIDNTNLTYKECKAYIELAKKYGYDCTIETPKTPWANNPEECATKNTHGVPLEKLKEMLAKKQSVKQIWEKAKELI